MNPRRKRRITILAKGVALLVAVVGIDALWDRYRPLPKPMPGDASRGQLAFSESDLGSKDYFSVPRAVFDALPEVYPDLFVEGWEGMGFIPRPEDPQGPPIGLVRVQVKGMEAYATNCAVCHTGRVGQMTIVGAPNANLNLHQFGISMFTSLKRSELTVDSVDAVATKKGKPLTFLERQGIRVWLTVARAKIANKSTQWFTTELGPGRSDAINVWKRVLHVPENGHKAWVDIPNVYNQRLKTHTLLDGSMTGDAAVRASLTELEKGRPPREVLLHRQVFDDIIAYMNERLAPPKFPFPLDDAKVARGRAVFDDTCSSCHGTYGAGPHTYPNKRVRSDRLGTDPERALAMTPAMADPVRKYGYDDMLTVDAQPAYIAPPLDGVWATAPYLHNGSVPTLWHLLQDESNRPTVFWRGFNEYDSSRVGFVCAETGTALHECAMDATQRKHDPRVIFRYDANKSGNLNRGHLFGVSLPAEDKEAIVEYLKTI
jgi:mono/diheme cytochrome c family protein